MNTLKKWLKSLQKRRLGAKIDNYDPSLRRMPFETKVDRYLAVVVPAFTEVLRAWEQVNHQYKEQGKQPLDEPMPPKLLQDVLMHLATHDLGYYLVQVQVLRQVNMQLWAERYKVEEQSKILETYEDEVHNLVNIATNAIKENNAVKSGANRLN